jgi:hypothetical protein
MTCANRSCFSAIACLHFRELIVRRSFPATGN